VLRAYLVDRANQYRHARCPRTDRYEYAFDGPRRPDQFYDLERDPEKLHDRIDDPDDREAIARHRELLLERLVIPTDITAPTSVRPTGSYGPGRGEPPAVSSR